MPISIKEITDYQMSVVLSSTKEDLEKLTDIELTTISDIIRCRKNNKDIRLYLIQNLLDAVHFLIMQEQDRLKNEISDKQKSHRTIGNLLRNWNVVMKDSEHYEIGKNSIMEQFNTTDVKY